MALATQCPHCKTSFRVAQDQLKLRGGIVRCGACHEIFDANASLVDLDAAPAAHTEPAPPVHEEQPAAAPITETPLPAAAAGDGSAHAPAANEPDASMTQAPSTTGEGELPQVEEAPGDVHAATGSLAQPEPESDESAGIEAWSAEEPVPADAYEAGHVGEAAQANEAVEHADEDAALAAEALERADEDAAQTAEAVEHAYEVAAQTGEAAEAEGAEPAVIDTGAEPEPAQARAEPRPVFSMGSALLAEPGHEGRSASHDGRLEPTLAPPVDEELVATALPGHHDDTESDLQAQAERVARAAAEHEPLPVRESTEGAQLTAAPAGPAKPARSRLTGRRSKLTPTRIAPPKLRVPEIDEPDFVKRGRQREENGKRFGIAMAVGSVLLALLLLAQAASTFRNEIAARLPATKPALASLCVLMRCRVELPARIDNLTIETGELQTLGPDTYVLSTLLHNQGSLAQAWPDIELALTDGNDKPLVRRVFAPAEYLPQGLAGAAGFGAHAEQPVKLYFQLDQLKPSGYHIAVFYR
jgi:predicted Zn finger-like uncharacterized protein